MSVRGRSRAAQLGHVLHRWPSKLTSWDKSTFWLGKSPWYIAAAETYIQPLFTHNTHERDIWRLRLFECVCVWLSSMFVLEIILGEEEEEEEEWDVTVGLIGGKKADVEEAGEQSKHSWRDIESGSRVGTTPSNPHGDILLLDTFLIFSPHFQWAAVSTSEHLVPTYMSWDLAEAHLWGRSFWQKVRTGQVSSSQKEDRVDSF